MPVPHKINMDKRNRMVKVYFSMHEFMKLKKLAKKSKLKLSPFIRQKVLSNGINVRYLKGTSNSDPIERINKKQIEIKLEKDPLREDWKVCREAIKKGVELVPVGSFDDQLKFIGVDE